MKIAVLASGGVDSSFALHKLKNEGHDVSAHYLKIWNPKYEQSKSSCPWQDDIDSVKAICNLLNVPMITHNLQVEYEFTVMAYMLDELRSGRTPNPDIYCNYYIKFGAFFENISFSEYDCVASGHYASKKNILDNHIYWHSADPLKDQSFFLAKLKPKQFEKIIFPCSGLNKANIREYANLHNLPQKDRKDSQGLCFIGKINYTNFISDYIPNKLGIIYNYEDGSRLGTHNGLHLYAIGQRHGLNIPNGPWYVAYKEIQDNRLFVINKKRLHTTMTNIMPVNKFNYFFNEEATYFKYKHPQIKLLSGKHVLSSDGEPAILLNEEISQLAFSPGQIVAMYNSEYKLIGNCVIA